MERFDALSETQSVASGSARGTNTAGRGSESVRLVLFSVILCGSVHTGEWVLEIKRRTRPCLLPVLRRKKTAPRRWRFVAVAAFIPAAREKHKVIFRIPSILLPFGNKPFHLLLLRDVLWHSFLFQIIPHSPQNVQDVQRKKKEQKFTTEVGHSSCDFYRLNQFILISEGGSYQKNTPRRVCALQYLVTHRLGMSMTVWYFGRLSGPAPTSMKVVCSKLGRVRARASSRLSSLVGVETANDLGRLCLAANPASTNQPINH